MKKFVAKANQRISENRNIGKRLKSGHNHWISSTTQCLKITKKVSFYNIYLNFRAKNVYCSSQSQFLLLMFVSIRKFLVFFKHCELKGLKRIILTKRKVVDDVAFEPKESESCLSP